ncbi:MAG TPA: outer membrane beta-barrel protein [Sphingobium sp.]|uniref:outer membrane beta-barrel protein n=1 Tax=Sphingobium sp. TaxID=1912891 RepID=UPI002ED058AD
MKLWLPLGLALLVTIPAPHAFGQEQKEAVLANPLTASGDADADNAPAPDDRAQEPSNDEPERYHRLLPFLAEKAIRRGYKLPRPFGISLIGTDNAQALTSGSLSVAFGKGAATPTSSQLVSVPFVSTERLKGSTTAVQLKADVWLLPYLNIFASVGRVKGTMDIGVVIDLNDLFPPPICTVRQPCAQQHLDFTGHIDNTIATLGALAVYGGDHWFVSASLAHTLSVTKGDRSNIRTTDAAIRLGPRLKVGTHTTFSPYFGADYFDLNTQVEGTLRVANAFPDGDDLSLRYQVQLENESKWAALAGLNVEFDERWYAQAEYSRNNTSHRLVASVSWRF